MTSQKLHNIHNNGWRLKLTNPAPFPRMSPGSPPGMAPDKCITCPEKEEVGFFCMDGLTLHFILRFF